MSLHCHVLNIRTALVRQVGVTWRSEFEIAMHGAKRD